jgi:ribonuclease Z
MFGVTILGNNSAVPVYNRHPTSQVINTTNRKLLIDCGEGTQIQMINYKIRRSRISHIFISHLHGDHYFGLVGLISSFALLGRIQELHIIGPQKLKDIIEMQLKMADTRLGYDLMFHEIKNSGSLMMIDDIEVSCFRTNHRIECYGFVFKEIKKHRKINAEKAKEYNVPFSHYEALREGKDYTSETGQIIKNEVLTFEAPKGKTYAYCADTKYDETILPHISGADMVYHETTYLDNFAERAALRFHSTTKQAGLIAKKAGVNKLLIGHFSSKYEKLEDFLTETCEVFANTELALEGVSYII